MSIIDVRREQLLPKLTHGRSTVCVGLGEASRYPAGKTIIFSWRAEPRHVRASFTALIAVTRRDGLGHVATDHRGASLATFSPRLSDLSGRPALVDAQAVSHVEALLIPPQRLRTLLIAETELGDKIMRALIVRRATLIDLGAGGPVLVGEESSSDMVRLQGFLARNGCPHQVLDPAADPDAKALVERYAPEPRDLPLAVCPDGSVLKNPTETELARCLGMVRQRCGGSNLRCRHRRGWPCGSGHRRIRRVRRPLGDRLRPARIRRTGRRQRAHRKLSRLPDWHFGPGARRPSFRPGAEIRRRFRHPESKSPELDCAERPLALVFGDDGRVQAKAVVVAAGARYRRLDIGNVKEFEGRGVWYWASPIEARMCRNEEAVVVGGGNAAGQAAVFLSAFAKKIWMLVRSASLAETMSRYLIERIAATGKYRGSLQHRSHCAPRLRRQLAGAGAMEKPSGRRGNRAPNPEPILVHRRLCPRPTGCAPAASLWTQRGLCRPAPMLFSPIRGRTIGLTDACRLNRASVAYSRSVMCGPGRLSASAGRSARGRPWSQNCIHSSLNFPRRRRRPRRCQRYDLRLTQRHGLPFGVSHPIGCKNERRAQTATRFRLLCSSPRQKKLTLVRATVVNQAIINWA